MYAAPGLRQLMRLDAFKAGIFFLSKSPLTFAAESALEHKNMLLRITE